MRTAKGDEYLSAAVKELEYLRNEAMYLEDDDLVLLVYLIDQAFVEACGRSDRDSLGAVAARRGDQINSTAPFRADCSDSGPRTRVEH